MRKNPIDEMLGVPEGAGMVYLDVRMSGLTTGQAIENQERNGQADAINSSKLPIDGTLDKLATWESLGFVFQDKDEDELFVNVIMPTGWHFIKHPEADSRHSLLLDEQGRRRAGMFYKAAFYDTKANIYLTRRFSVDGYASTKPNTVLVNVLDNAVTPPKVIMQSEEVEVPADKQNFEVRMPMMQAMREQLSKQYPDWDNPKAYW